MGKIPAKLVYWTIVALTLLSGGGAAATAIVTSIWQISDPSLTSLFGTLIHVFTGGVGAIFGLLAAR